MEMEQLKMLAKIGEFFSGGYEDVLNEINEDIDKYESLVGLANTAEKANQVLADAEKEKATAEGLVSKARDELSRAETRSNEVGQEIQQKAEAMTESLKAELDKKLETVKETQGHADAEKGKYRELNGEMKKELEVTAKELDDKASNLSSWEKDLEVRQSRIEQNETEIADKKAALAAVMNG